MSKRFHKLITSANGSIMIEGLMVYLITFTLLGLMLALYNLYYQRWNLQTIANESAMRIGQTYKYPTADTITGLVSKEELSSRDIYRYIGGDGGEEEARNRLIPYVLQRLSKTTYATGDGLQQLKVAIVPDSFARRHLELTLSGTYKIPFGELLSLVGGRETVTYTVTSYAECIDLSDYLSSVRYASDVAGMKYVSGSVTKLIDSVLSLIDTLLSR